MNSNEILPRSFVLGMLAYAGYVLAQGTFVADVSDYSWLVLGIFFAIPGILLCTLVIALFITIVSKLVGKL